MTRRRASSAGQRSSITNQSVQKARTGARSKPSTPPSYTICSPSRSRWSIRSSKAFVSAILSRGYHQRLALARALIHTPDVLIADEPETGLDPEGVALLDEMALTAPGLTVIAATHRIDHVDAWATGIVRLERGRVAEDTSSVASSAMGAPA